MLELADRHGLEPCARKGVWVQLPPSAPENAKVLLQKKDKGEARLPHAELVQAGQKVQR